MVTLWYSNPSGYSSDYLCSIFLSWIIDPSEYYIMCNSACHALLSQESARVRFTSIIISLVLKAISTRFLKSLPWHDVSPIWQGVNRLWTRARTDKVMTRKSHNIYPSTLENFLKSLIPLEKQLKVRFGHPWFYDQHHTCNAGDSIHKRILSALQRPHSTETQNMLVGGQF